MIFLKNAEFRSCTEQKYEKYGLRKQQNNFRMKQNNLQKQYGSISVNHTVPLPYIYI